MLFNATYYISDKKPSTVSMYTWNTFYRHVDIVLTPSKHVVWRDAVT